MACLGNPIRAGKAEPGLCRGGGRTERRRAGRGADCPGAWPRGRPLADPRLRARNRAALGAGPRGRTRPLPRPAPGQRGGRPGAGHPVPGPVRRAALWPPVAHHALNARPSERPEFYDPRKRSGWRARAAYYLRLLCGIYLLEIASGPLALLPRAALRPIVRWVFYDGAPDAGHMADRAERVLLAPATLRRMRIDTLAISDAAGGGLSSLWRCVAPVGGGSARPGFRRVDHGQRPALWGRARRP